MSSVAGNIATYNTHNTTFYITCEIIYRHPNVTFGGRAEIVILGLGQTTGRTFFARSIAGLRLMRFSSGVVSKEFIRVILDMDIIIF